MNIQPRSQCCGHTYREATVENIAADRPVSDDLLKGFVMASLGEDPSSLFGATVIRVDAATAVVRLYTD